MPVRRRSRRSLDSKAEEYISDKMRSAVWLIKSIQQRQRTIYKVAKSIVKFQRDFLDHGIEYLKPLVLRDVAEDIGMHESTISRVTTNKYMQTPQGLFELKYFFNSGISITGGDFIASESVKRQDQGDRRQRRSPQAHTATSAWPNCWRKTISTLPGAPSPSTGKCSASVHHRSGNGCFKSSAEF